METLVEPIIGTVKREELVEAPIEQVVVEVGVIQLNEEERFTI